MKRVVALVLACLVALPVGAQEPSPIPTGRVRITGVSTYEIPGVIKLEGDRVSGKAVRITDQFVQFSRPDGSQLVTLLRPAQQLTGRAKPVADGLLEFVPDGEAETLYVPLDAIAKTESLKTQTGRSVAKEVAIWTALAIGVLVLNTLGALMQGS